MKAQMELLVSKAMTAPRGRSFLGALCAGPLPSESAGSKWRRATGGNVAVQG